MFFLSSVFIILIFVPVFIFNAMQVVSSVADLERTIENYHKNGEHIGFVPTMGALHQGHVSLVQRSKKESDVTVVSIFVNPTQFNDKSDLRNYPRTLDADLAKLEQCKVDIVFTPSEKEMYPEPDTRVFDFGKLTQVMEGARRPGHFNGVAQIVSKLFLFVKPDKAFFGDKDFQQVAVIKQMVKMLDLPVQIISCPIIREPDGLAMSSRNALLSDVQRKNAVFISATLFESKERKDRMDVPELKKWVIDTINANPELEVDYFEIVDDLELLPVQSWQEPKTKVGCIAVKVGKIRLIDNIRYI